MSQPTFSLATFNAKIQSLTTDAEGNTTFLNPVAQALTGWTQEEAAGSPLDVVFKIVNEVTREIAMTGYGQDSDSARVF